MTCGPLGVSSWPSFIRQDKCGFGAGTRHGHALLFSAASADPVDVSPIREIDACSSCITRSRRSRIYGRSRAAHLDVS